MHFHCQEDIWFERTNHKFPQFAKPDSHGGVVSIVLFQENTKKNYLLDVVFLAHTCHESFLWIQDIKKLLNRWSNPRIYRRLEEFKNNVSLSFMIIFLFLMILRKKIIPFSERFDCILLYPELEQLMIGESLIPS